MISPYDGLPTRQLDGGNTTGQIENRLTAQVSETEPVATETKVEWRQNQRKRAACMASTARRKARTSPRGRRSSPRYGLRWFCLSEGTRGSPQFFKRTSHRKPSVSFGLRLSPVQPFRARWVAQTAKPTSSASPLRQ